MGGFVPRSPGIWLAASLIALPAWSADGVAQVVARADLTFSTRYVWHGLSRAAGAVMQPSVALGYGFTPKLTVQAGGVAHLELDRVGADELTESGRSRTLGEDDFWASLAFDPGPVRLEAGAVRYRFEGSPAGGGLGSDQNTTELWWSIAAPEAVFAPALQVWTDVGRVRGSYLSATVQLPVLAWPYQPFIFAHVDAEAGWNLGQGPNPAEPLQHANFATRGPTHAAFGLTLDLRTAHWPSIGLGSVRAGLRTQLNFDDATRADGPTRRKDSLVWVWLGTTVALGGPARSAR